MSSTVFLKCVKKSIALQVMRKGGVCPEKHFWTLTLSQLITSARFLLSNRILFSQKIKICIQSSRQYVMTVCIALSASSDNRLTDTGHDRDIPDPHNRLPNSPGRLPANPVHPCVSGHNWLAAASAHTAAGCSSGPGE